jgi:hypothetical protein
MHVDSENTLCNGLLESEYLLFSLSNFHKGSWTGKGKQIIC